MTAAKDALAQAVGSLVDLAKSLASADDQGSTGQPTGSASPTPGTGTGTGSSGTGTSGTGSTGTGSTGTGSTGTGTQGTGSSGTGSSGTGTGGTGTGGTATAGSPSGSGASGASGSASGGGSGGGTTTVGQAEASVADAQLALTNAQLSRTQATLVAPIDGTVTALPWTVGGKASTSDVATIMGAESVSMTITVGETSITKVKVGQPVKVTSSTGTVSDGHVSAISILPSSTTSSTAVYPVTVVVGAPQAGLTAGTTATAVVTIASADDAVVIPVSAVTLTGSSAGTVKVLDSNHQASTAQVTLGIVGSTQVQVSSGVSAGTLVILADTSSAIPTSTTSSRMGSSGSSLTGGSSGLPGGLTGAGGGGAPPKR